MNNTEVVGQAVSQVTDVTMETIKQQLLKEALDIIKGTKEGVLKALDYLQAQIPDIIKQFLSWELAISIICFAIGLACISFGLWSCKRWGKAVKENDSLGDGLACWCVGNILLLVSGITFIIANTIKITQILVAPKIFLIKYILANIQNIR